MARYIDVNDLFIELNRRKIPFIADVNCAILTTPKADVAEVIHAKWIINSDGYYPYCSNCKNEPENGIMSNYCPDCGARMMKE